MSKENCKEILVHQNATTTAAVGHAPHVLARQPVICERVRNELTRMSRRIPSLASAVALRGAAPERKPMACDEPGDVPYGVANRFCAAKPSHRHRRRRTTSIFELTSRKAQTQEIFIYAIGIVIVGLILIFGYRAIRNIGSQQETVKAVEFRTQLANDIKGIGFGDVRIREYPIPKGFSFVCIADKNNFIPGACFPSADFEANYPIVTDAIKTANKDNIFLGGNEIAPDSFALEKVGLGEGICYQNGVLTEYPVSIAVKCFDVTNGKLELRLEGKGSSIIVSEVTD